MPANVPIVHRIVFSMTLYKIVKMHSFLVIYPGISLSNFLYIHSRLKACIPTSDTREISRYVTPKHCITTKYTYFEKKLSPCCLTAYGDSPCKPPP